jgi:hypothetical protein
MLPQVARTLAAELGELDEFPFETITPLDSPALLDVAPPFLRASSKTSQASQVSRTSAHSEASAASEASHLEVIAHRAPLADRLTPPRTPSLASSRPQSMVQPADQRALSVVRGELARVRSNFTQAQATIHESSQSLRQAEQRNVQLGLQVRTARSGQASAQAAVRTLENENRGLSAALADSQRAARATIQGLKREVASLTAALEEARLRDEDAQQAQHDAVAVALQRQSKRLRPRGVRTPSSGSVSVLEEAPSGRRARNQVAKAK